MCGYGDNAIATRNPPKQYCAVPAAEGWRVTVNGCMTGPLKRRAEAERLARRLQRESDSLTHPFEVAP